jgi:hypothetical protein
VSTKSVSKKFNQVQCGYYENNTHKAWQIPTAFFFAGSRQSYADNSTRSYAVTYFIFTTPYFEGTSKSVTMHLVVEDLETVPIRFAISESYTNRDKYRATHSDVSEEHQIVSGVAQVVSKVGNTSSSTSYVADIVIDTTKLEPNETYYLYLWAADGGYRGNYDISFHASMFNEMSFTLTYYENTVHIDTGSELKAHKCYLDNGEYWATIVPYIDTGTTWKPCV